MDSFPSPGQDQLRGGTNKNHIHLPQRVVQRSAKEATDVIDLKPALRHETHNLSEEWRTFVDFNQIHFQQHRLNVCQCSFTAFQNLQLKPLDIKLDKVGLRESCVDCHRIQCGEWKLKRRLFSPG